ATGSVDLVVWLDSTATDADINAVRTFLDGSPAVRSSSYKDQESAWADFQLAYADQPEVLELVHPTDLPTSFQVDLEVNDSDVVAALENELQALPNVSQTVSDYAFEQYEWDEAGATIVVDGPRGASPAIEALIADLTVTPQNGGLPLVALDGVPDGWAVLAGPSAPATGPVPVLNFVYSTGSGSLNVTRQPSFDPQQELTPVPVRGRDGYFSEPPGQGVTLTWPLAEEGWWAQLVGSGATRGQALALAEAVTFTDRTVWTARYAAQPPNPLATVPPTTVYVPGLGGGAAPVATPALPISQPVPTTAPPPGFAATTAPVPPGATYEGPSYATTTQS
ncbi:MAG: permease-like cell division protein FtsX, partial [Acidimicrobiia bacterium]|nr:permease-like cell division protein FtsX [Acidimicrobiia bacterium]